MESVHLEQITPSMQPANEPIGMIEEVHGPVIDVVCERLPPLHQALFCAFDHEHYTFEVYRHLDQRHVRAIALHPTAGLKRGLPVFDSGGPLRIPVTPDCLNRLLDMFGAPLDGGPPLVAGEMRDIIARYPAENPRLFGSVARGEDTEASDVDILVDRKEGLTLFDLAGMMIELEACIGARVDVVTSRPLAIPPAIIEVKDCLLSEERMLFRLDFSGADARSIYPTHTSRLQLAMLMATKFLGYCSIMRVVNAAFISAAVAKLVDLSESTFLKNFRAAIVACLF